MVTFTVRAAPAGASAADAERPSRESLTMIDHTSSLHSRAGGNGDLPGSAPSSHHGLGWKSWQVVKIVWARLRFFLILAAIGLVLGYWDTLSGYYEKWTRPLRGQVEAAASDTEYFCPMHPFIVRDNRKEKCPICHMDLAKRKKGSTETEPLPPGTVSRVQLSPYRVVLAGVRTTEVQYRPLSKEMTTFGSVEFNEEKLAHVATRQKGRIVKLFANYTGQHVEKGAKLAVLDIRYSSELMVTLEDLRRASTSGNSTAEKMARDRLKLWDVGEAQIKDFLRTGKVSTEMTVYSPIKGHVTKKYQREGSFVEDGTPLYDVANLDTVWIEAQVYEADQSLLTEGLKVQATTLGLPGRSFPGTLDFIYPHLDEASRTLTVRYHLPNPHHHLRPGMYATVKIDVPPAKIGTLSAALGEDWAALNTADLLAHALGSPIGGGAGGGLLPLLHAAGGQALLHRGLVLTVPDSAVIDTGSLKVVYRESAPNTYEGVAVRLGPRMSLPDGTAAFYPVLHGLEAGDHIVTNGSFLIDAETRLNPAAGSIYFGGSGGKSGSAGVNVRPSTPEDEGTQDRKVKAELAKLPAEDRRLAEAQKYCPVLQTNRLGSMGPPVKVLIEGVPVFLCCGSCDEKAKTNAEKTLQTVGRLKKGKAGPSAPTSTSPSPATGEEARIQANLARLSASHRALAVAQKYCPVTGERLGDPGMGVPVKVTIKGQEVFLCCKGCAGEARDHPAEVLAKVEKLKQASGGLKQASGGR
jgi:Cu(I)/Ag(I) efflux system membrane fusion protein